MNRYTGCMLSVSLTLTLFAGNPALAMSWDEPVGYEPPPGQNLWGTPGALLPQATWDKYVHRPSAFVGVGTWTGDPARTPLLTTPSRSSSRSSGASRATSQKKSTAPTAQKKADPCAEQNKQLAALAAQAKSAQNVPKPATPTVVQPKAPSAPFVDTPQDVNANIPSGTAAHGQPPVVTVPRPTVQQPVSSPVPVVPKVPDIVPPRLP